MGLFRPAVSLIEFSLGGVHSQALSGALVKAGLRGLGVNIGHQLDRSGELNFLKQLVHRFREGWIFDVGANIGTYSEALYRLGSRSIVAFEASPATFRRLSDRMSGRAELVNKAVGETEGEIEFHVPLKEAQSTLASRDIAITSIADEAFERVTAPMISLDAFTEESGREPIFVKIDVEGFELEVLKGMGRLLRRAPPRAIQFEYNTHHMMRRQNMMDFASLLPDYNLFRLARRSLRPLDPGHYLSNIYAYSNVVAIHGEALKSFRQMYC